MSELFELLKLAATWHKNVDFLSLSLATTAKVSKYQGFKTLLATLQSDPFSHDVKTKKIECCDSFTW